MISATMRNFYTQQSRISDPGEYARLFGDLPTTLPDLVAVINNIFVHVDIATRSRRDMDWEGRDRTELELHRVQDLLRCALELKHAPLTELRRSGEKVLVTCLQFQILLVSILRHRGKPARIRYGFPTYYVSDQRPLMSNHALVETVLDGEDHWTRVDVELGSIYERRIPSRLGFDLCNVPMEVFQNPAHVYSDILWGKLERPEETYGFGIQFGDDIVIPTMLYDAACLVGTEPLPWSVWGFLHNPRYRDDWKIMRMLTWLAAALLEFDNNPEFLQNLMGESPMLRIPENFAGKRELVYPGVS